MFPSIVHAARAVHACDDGRMARTVRGARVLITGAASGMGRLYAERAVREGARAVVLWDRDAAALTALTDALRAVTLMRNSAGLDDRIVGTSANLEEVRRLIVAGLGIGPLPIHVVTEDVAAGRLWRLPPYENPPAIDVHVAWNPRTRSNRAEQAMLQRLLETIEQTPLEERIYI